jgi:translation initiation factor IF-3
LRINEQIRIPQVRLFDDTTNEAFGIVPIERARQIAQERELDLVEVAPQAQPPVARLMDYGRFKFEALKREKESRREHNVVRLKEMKLRPKISEHDFQTKFGYVRHFLQEGDKVKLTIMFRGREMVHQEYGRRLLDRMANELKEVATIERNPLVEGRNMIMIMSPLSKKASRGPQGAAEPGQPEAAGEPQPAQDAPEPQPAQAAPEPQPAQVATEPQAAQAPEPQAATSTTTRSTENNAQDQNP